MNNKSLSIVLWKSQYRLAYILKKFLNIFPTLRNKMILTIQILDYCYGDPVYYFCQETCLKPVVFFVKIKRSILLWIKKPFENFHN